MSDGDEASLNSGRGSSSPDASPSHPAGRVRLLVCDVDGVLTDGTITLDGQDTEIKGFSVVDGLGIHLLKSVDIQVGVLTGRESDVVARRAAELDLDFCEQGARTKLPRLEAILERLEVPAGEAAYIGDDLIDLPCLNHVGFPVAVANAHPEVKRVAAYHTRLRGGQGAVRETAELLIRARGRWQEVLERFFS